MDVFDIALVTARSGRIRVWYREDEGVLVVVAWHCRVIGWERHWWASRLLLVWQVEGTRRQVLYWWQR